MKAHELERLQQDIADAKQQKARAEGALQTHMKSLATNFKCKTLKKAQTKLQDLYQEEKEVNEQLTAKLDEIEELYD